jgi:deoxyribonuclease V
MGSWPGTAEALVEAQLALAAARPAPWRPRGGDNIAGCFVCFERGSSGPGRKGDHGWAAAALGAEIAVITGEAGAPYQPGLLALREGELLERAVRALRARPDALLVDATGHDHPRRVGLAVQLGSVLELPTVGVTHRPLIARGEWPPDEQGAASALLLEGELVGYWLRTRAGRRPLVVHGAWRTDPATALEVVVACTSGTRTPEPLRLARRAARAARAEAEAGSIAKPSGGGRDLPG